MPRPNWSVSFPSTDPTLKELPISAETHELLRFDQGRQAEWQEADGTTWYGFYFEWQPGKVAGYLAKRHTRNLHARRGPKVRCWAGVNGYDN